MSSCFPSGRCPFDLWVWFSYKHRWRGSRIWWRMIWAHLIFRLIIFRCHTRACSLFWSRFVDLPLICMITIDFEIHIGLTIRFHCVLILRGASLESLSQIHVFWYSRDSWTELSQARGFPVTILAEYMLDPLYVPMDLSLSYQDRLDVFDAILGHVFLI